MQCRAAAVNAHAESMFKIQRSEPYERWQLLWEGGKLTTIVRRKGGHNCVSRPPPSAPLPRVAFQDMCERRPPGVRCKQQGAGLSVLLHCHANRAMEAVLGGTCAEQGKVVQC